MNSDYRDMLALPYPYTSRRKRMALTDRAAQFAPFAALTGYDDGIAEKSRQKEPSRALKEYQQEILDQKMRYLLDKAPEHPDLIVQYIPADFLNSGDKCGQLSGRLKQIDFAGQQLILEDGTTLQMNQILDILLIKQQ